MQTHIWSFNFYLGTWNKNYHENYKCSLIMSTISRNCHLSSAYKMTIFCCPWGWLLISKANSTENRSFWCAHMVVGGDMVLGQMNDTLTEELATVLAFLPLLFWEKDLLEWYFHLFSLHWWLILLGFDFERNRKVMRICCGNKKQTSYAKKYLLYFLICPIFLK